MKITAINQTEKAKRKIKKIAENNHLEFDLVYFIASFRSNYDNEKGNQKIENIENDSECEFRYKFIADKLGLTKESISKTQIITAILEKLNSLDDSILHKHFIYGATHKNYCFISEYASYHYLANATKENLSTLDLYPPELSLSDIIDWIFTKIVAGGGIHRYNLDYLYADLVIELPYQKKIIKDENWDKIFIQQVNEKRKDMKLSDLASTLKQFCKGDKYFIQTILEALSYSGILEIENHSVENKFTPDYRNELAPHFYSNEWTYPLRFWKKK